MALLRSRSHNDCVPLEGRKLSGPLAYRLLAVSFIVGWVTMGLEMVVGRALIPHFGSSVYTWGAVISVFLFGIAFGYFAGGYLSKRFPERATIIVLDVSAGIWVLLLPLVVSPICTKIATDISDPRWGAGVGAMAMSFFPVAALSATAPVSVRLAVANISTVGVISGGLAALGAIGSIAGTVVTSFFMIPAVGVKTNFLVLGMLSIASAALLFTWSIDRGELVE